MKIKKILIFVFVVFFVLIFLSILSSDKEEDKKDTEQQETPETSLKNDNTSSSVPVEVKQEQVLLPADSGIVKTDIGDEFGIDPNAVVNALNGNDFARKVLSDFSKANLVFEDKKNNRDLKLKAEISPEGKITRLEDGSYDSPDVALYMPLDDALKIFNDAENITPVELLLFAANVRTDPPSIKNEVVGKILKGEYK